MLKSLVEPLIFSLGANKLTIKRRRINSAALKENREIKPIGFGGASFVDRFCQLYFMLMCVVLSCLFLAAL